MEILSHCKNAVCDRVTTGIQALGTGDIPGGAGMRCLKNRTGGPGSPFSSTVCGWVCRKARVERNGGNGSDRYSPGRIGFYALRGTIRRVHVEKWIHPRRVEEDPEPRANHKATVDLGLVRKPDAGRKVRINLFVDRVDPTGPLRHETAFARNEYREIVLAISWRSFVVPAHTVVECQLGRPLPGILCKERECLDMNQALGISEGDDRA